MARFHDLYEAVVALDCARLRQLVRRGADINCRDSMKRTVLHHAAENLWHVWDDRVRDVIQTLVDLGADVNTGDIKRMTPLHYSLCNMESDLANADDLTASAIAFLISLGADVNAKFDGKVTSLHRAIKLKNIRGIETLLRLGVDVNANKVINYTAIQVAIERKWMTLLENLVKLGVDTNSVKTILPPLPEAIRLGRLDIVELLVQYGADVNSRTLDMTPVMHAVSERIPHALKSLGQPRADLNAKLQTSTIVNEIVEVGRVDILEYLVGHGADIVQVFQQFTALGMAVFFDYHEMVDCLLKNGADANVRHDQTLSPFLTAIRLGDTDMVRALANLAPYSINKHFIENTTILHKACDKEDTKILKLLLKYGGDVNVKHDWNVTLVHEAVALGDGKMLRVLAELGVNLNFGKGEGVGLIDYILLQLRSEKAERQMALIKVLVEAGVDLNQSYNVHVTPLHDAVRLSNLEIVQILGELKVNVIATKSEATPISAVISTGTCRADLVRYFAENRVDLNRKITTLVTPLHDAVRKGDVYMARLLTKYGAHKGSRHKSIQTALTFAITMRNNDMVKCLLECGADINAKISLNISALHDAVEKSDLGMIDVLTDCRFLDSIAVMQDQVTPLVQSLQADHLDITETLLKHGADMNCLQSTLRTPLDVALDQGKVGSALLLMSRLMIVCRDTVGSSPLHRACQLGHIDLARILIIAGSNVRKQDYWRVKPLEHLQLDADYHVLQETITATKVTEQVLTSSVSTSGCQHMKTSLHTPGIGDVKYISSPSATEISQRVNQLLISTIQQCKAFPWKSLVPIGSSAEGTRVGLPNEMDFLVRVGLSEDEQKQTEDLGNGYAKYIYDFRKERSPKNTKSYNTNLHDRSMFLKKVSESVVFHDYFIEEVMNEVFVNLEKTESDEKVSVHHGGSKAIIDTDRKACSTLTLMWQDRSLFLIPVDIVPSVHIDNWPKGATTRTWLMGEKELRSRGYVLVPKPPHVKSDLAKECTKEELKTLWKISFPHLETEHMQRLEQRVKDVYITAKCLRNPDVCRIVITDDGSLPRTVDKYVTSYQLKMCFFRNVEYFLQHHLSLEGMVCKVYDDLVLGLSKNFIPLFFLPKVSALSGINLDVPKCLKVAKIMARFVRALYLRDSLEDFADGGDDLVMTVYQRNPGSVYRVHDISDDQVMTVYQRNPSFVDMIYEISTVGTFFEEQAE